MMNIDMIYLEFLASMLIIIYSSKKGNKITVLLVKTNESDHSIEIIPNAFRKEKTISIRMDVLARIVLEHIFKVRNINLAIDHLAMSPDL